MRFFLLRRTSVAVFSFEKKVFFPQNLATQRPPSPSSASLLDLAVDQLRLLTGASTTASTASQPPAPSSSSASSSPLPSPPSVARNVSSQSIFISIINSLVSYRFLSRHMRYIAIRSTSCIDLFREIRSNFSSTMCITSKLGKVHLPSFCLPSFFFVSLRSGWRVQRVTGAGRRRESSAR